MNTPNKFLKINFLLIKRYQDFIISVFYPQNKYYQVSVKIKFDCTETP